MPALPPPPTQPLSACPPSSAASPKLWPGAAPAAACVAGVYCVLVTVFLFAAHFQARRSDPLRSAEMAKLKASLAQNSGQDALKREVRALDLRLRQAHERQLARARGGVWLLAGGAVVGLFSLQSLQWRKKVGRPPRFAKLAGADARARWQASLAVGGLAVVATVFAGWLSERSRTELSAELARPAPTNAPATAVAAATPYPTLEEVRRQWPRFRGPGGSGVSTCTNPPAAWNAQTGEGVRWKTTAPTADPNSPVVWGDRLFLTGGNVNQREVFCYDTDTGNLRWRKTVNGNGERLELPKDSSGYAASTAAADGRRVYAIFANSDVAALDFDGNQAWCRNLGKFENAYGYATSLELYQDRLLVLADQGDGEDGKSKLLALDTATGKTIWESASRPVPNSWATPIVIQVGERAQVITAAKPWVIAYDQANGTELWRAKVLQGEVAPSPIFAAGYVLTVNEGAQLSALRPDGSGDVTKSHLAWSADEGLPDICSPLSDGQRVYLLGTYGAFTCYDATTGKKLFDKELELEFNASPCLAGDRLYLFSEKGTTLILAAGPEFKELGRAELEEGIRATPAFVNDRIYVRAKAHLYCLGPK